MFKSKNTVQFLEFARCEFASPCFTFIPKGKFDLNYMRSSGTHPSHKMRPHYGRVYTHTHTHPVSRWRSWLRQCATSGKVAGSTQALT
jgi:hypothetical protein